MSKYTTELRYICQSLVPDYEKISHRELLKKASEKIFDRFECLDDETSERLKMNILDIYFFREIGFETYGRFKIALNRHLHLVLPTYAEMYRAQKLLYGINPVTDVNYNETSSTASNENAENSLTGNGTNSVTVSNSGENSTTSNATDTKLETVENTNSLIKTGSEKTTTSGTDRTSNTVKQSDTPQNNLSGVDSDTYLTNYAKNDTSLSKNNNSVLSFENRTDTTNFNGSTNDSYSSKLTQSGTYKNNNNSESESSVSNSSTLAKTATTEITTHKEGKLNSSNYGEMIKSYNQACINIDYMIIAELNPLFMSIW